MRAWLVTVLFSGGALAAPTTYTLTPESTLDARIYKAGVASRMAHDHVIRASEVRGQVTYDPAAPHTMALQVTVPTATLQADPARVRHQYGLPADIGDDDRKAVEKNMKGRYQLDVAKYPEITFKLTLAARVGGKFIVEGDLSIRGQTKRVNLPVEITADGQRFVGTGEVRVHHRDFGFEPYSAALGAVRNQEKIDLILKLAAAPK
ncbi:MAG: YceI family protein [Myxococcales bacterium]|nr:YceI family protein [Myxococcales bacterium]